MLSNEALRFTIDALWLVLLLSAPPVVVAAALGLLVAFVQAATQIQEQTFQYAVKFFAIVLTIFVTASLLGGTLLHYTERLMNEFPAIVKRR
jgi:type III secretion protein S